MYKNLIAGNWVEAAETAPNINPSDTNDIQGYYAIAEPAQMQDAISAACDAFPIWSRSGLQQRFDTLDRIGSEILSRTAELGDLLAREEGKSIPEAIGEVGRAGQVFKFFAGEVLRVAGDRIGSVRPGVEIDVTREPLGVVGIITPWNFPIAIPAWKIAPALAYGNCVVFKPAELTPGCAWALAEIIQRNGIPEGVFNLVMGRGGEVGEALLNDKRVAAVSFTGSANTGRRVASVCAQRGAKYQLEMGGKNPLVILDDADMATAVNCAVNGGYFSTGQRCTASSRIIVESGIHDDFVNNLAKTLADLRVGDARDKTTQIGPVVDQKQLDQDLRYLTIGQDEGATLLTGGERLELPTPGYYLKPALFVGTQNEMRINQEEIFGPIASVIRVADFDEAVAVANDTPFGLSAGICTRSLSASSRFRQGCEAGMIMVNLPTAGVDYHVPFGGTKASSYGAREQGAYAAEFYTKVKTTYILAG